MATNLSSRLTFRAATKQDGPRLQEIVRESFPEEAARNGRAIGRYLQEPYYDPGNLLVAELEGEVVSQLGLRQGAAFIKGKSFPGSVVGTVCTTESLRGKGIGAALMNYALETITARGDVLSRLFTSPERYAFYERLAYIRTPVQWPRSTITLDEKLKTALPELARLPEGFARRRGAQEDAEQLDVLYEPFFGRLTGGMSRSLEFWKSRLAGQHKLWMRGVPVFDVLTRSDGSAAGYAAVMEEADPPCIVELVAVEDAPEAPRLLVGSILQRLAAAGHEQVALELGEHSPLWPALAPFAPVDGSEDDVVFLQLHHAAPFLEQALPELDRRATEVDATVKFALPDNNRPYPAGRGSQKFAVSLTPGLLLSLCYNGRELAELVKSRAVRLEPNTPSMRGLLARILPETFAFRCRMDGY